MVCHCQHLSAKVELANIDPMYQYSLQWFLDEACEAAAAFWQSNPPMLIHDCSEVPAVVPACRGSITKIWCAGGQEQKWSARIHVQDIKLTIVHPSVRQRRWQVKNTKSKIKPANACSHGWPVQFQMFECTRQPVDLFSGETLWQNFVEFASGGKMTGMTCQERLEILQVGQPTLICHYESSCIIWHHMFVSSSLVLKAPHPQYASRTFSLNLCTRTSVGTSVILPCLTADHDQDGYCEQQTVDLDRLGQTMKKHRYFYNEG